MTHEVLVNGKARLLPELRPHPSGGQSRQGNQTGGGSGSTRGKASRASGVTRTDTEGYVLIEKTSLNASE